MESRTAELVLYRRERADSQGHGRFRGGAGIELAMTPHKNPEPVIHVTISAFASQPDNQGLSGGTPAAVNYNVLLRGSDGGRAFAAGVVPADPDELACERREVVAAKAHSLVGAGDVHVYLQTGGGGYGDPLRRDPALSPRTSGAAWFRRPSLARCTGWSGAPERTSMQSPPSRRGTPSGASVWLKRVRLARRNLSSLSQGLS